MAIGELLIAGSWLFWLVIGIYVFILFALVENSYNWCSTLLTILLLVALQFMFNIDIPGTIWNHPYLTGLGIIAYFAIGAFWSGWKWFLYVSNRARKYFDLKAEWFDDNNLDPNADGVEEKWVKYLKEDYHADMARQFSKRPIVGNYKAEIILWVTYWPVSFLWWALHDIIRDIGNAVYNYIASVLQAIADRVYEKIKKDLPDGWK